MTIICIKDGIIAADGSVICGHTIDAANVKKIMRSPGGALGACAGPTSVCARVRHLFLNMPESARAVGNIMIENLRPLLGDDAFQAIWIEPTGEIRRMRENGVVSSCGETMAAVGSAEDFALGAMRAGASAEQAVRLCIEHTIYAAGEVQVERLAPREPVELVDHTAGDGDGEAWVSADWSMPADDQWKEKQGLR